MKDARNMIHDTRLPHIGLFLILVSCFLHLASEKVQAEGFSVSPSKASITLIPGKSSEGMVRITNTSTLERSFRISAHDFAVENGTNTPVFNVSNANNSYSFASWIGITPDFVTLKPQQTEEVYYFINTPQNAEPGGRYAGIIVNPLETSTATSSAVIQTHIAILLSGTVPGTVQNNWKLATAAKNWYEYGPVSIKSSLYNQGNIHIAVIGTVTLSDIFGREIDSQTITKANIFPQNNLQYTTTLGKGFMIGRYKVLARFTNALNSTHKTATLYVWVIPWKLLTCATVVLLVSILVFLILKPTKKKTEIKI